MRKFCEKPDVCEGLKWYKGSLDETFIHHSYTSDTLQVKYRNEKTWYTYIVSRVLQHLFENYQGGLAYHNLPFPKAILTKICVWQQKSFLSLLLSNIFIKSNWWLKWWPMVACHFRTLVVLYRMFTFIMCPIWLMFGILLRHLSFGKMDWIIYNETHLYQIYIQNLG